MQTRDVGVPVLCGIWAGIDEYGHEKLKIITGLYHNSIFRRHQATVIDGIMSIEEYQKVDGQSVALDLIQSGRRTGHLKRF